MSTPELHKGYIYCCTADPLAWVWPHSLVWVYLASCVILAVCLYASPSAADSETRRRDPVAYFVGVVFLSLMSPILWSIIIREEIPAAMRRAAEARDGDH